MLLMAINSFVSGSADNIEPTSCIRSVGIGAGSVPRWDRPTNFSASTHGGKSSREDLKHVVPSQT